MLKITVSFSHLMIALLTTYLFMLSLNNVVFILFDDIFQGFQINYFQMLALHMVMSIFSKQNLYMKEQLLGKDYFMRKDYFIDTVTTLSARGIIYCAAAYLVNL